MIGLAVGFACSALFLSAVAACVSAWALIDVQAFRRSTHQVQYVPVDEAFDKRQTDELNKKYDAVAQETWDNLGTVDPKDQTI